MRLIDADELLNMTKSYKSELGRLKADPFVKSGIETVENFIKEMPTIIETPTVNAIPILDGTTNGDMIKAMLQIKDEDIKAKNSCVTNQVFEYIIDTGNYLLRFDSIFWNAPYKENEKQVQEEEIRDI